MKPRKKKKFKKRKYHRIGNEDLYGAMLRVMTRQKLYLDKTFSRERLARELMTNRTYVSRVLNAHGLTFAQFINSFRAEHAISLLAREDMADAQVGDIAELSGFSTVERMNRYLKKSAGLPACALRKRLTEGG